MKIDYHLLEISPDASEEEVRERINTLLRKWYYRLNSPRLEHRQEAERMIQELEKMSSALSQLDIKDTHRRKMVQQMSKLPRMLEKDEQASMGGSEEDIQTVVEEKTLQETTEDDQKGTAKEETVQIFADEQSLRKAAKAGQAEAMWKLGDYLLQGDGIGQDLEGIYWLQQAVKTGNREAMLSLGQYYFKQKNGKEKKKGEYWLKKAAKAGLIAAMRELGHHSTSPKEKAKWLRKAGEAGDPISMRELGSYLLHGKGIKPSKKWGTHWLRKAAEAGELEAMRELALYLLKEKEDEKALAEGKEWLQRAAEQGDSIAYQMISEQFARINPTE
jgi:TPR repeat protein